MAKFLAIETSSHICSVALHIDGVVTTKEAEGPKSHTQSVLGFIDQLLVESNVTLQQLNGIIFAAGPGAFTGVRLAASVAKSLAYAAHIPVIPVSSLAAIAQTAFSLSADSSDCWIITDARMGEVYKGYYSYRNGVACALIADQMVPVHTLALEGSADRIIGDAKALIESQFPHCTFLNVQAKAEDLFVLGEQVLQAGLQQDALSAQAIYLRDKTSWKNTAQQLIEKSSSAK